MRLKNVIYLFAVVLLLGSCAAPKIAYLQDRQIGKAEDVINVQDIQIRPKDKILILVNSKDPLLVNLFNLPIASRQITSSSNTSSSSQGVSGYTVDNNGDIDFPVLGKLHIEGKTREEVATYIKNELKTQNLVKDPVVTVEFMNLTVSVLGEVSTPGRYNIDKDRLTILEAISMAGDLTIYGKRDNILVQREDKGKLLTYQVDLSSGANLYSSPVYYLQQNDVIYVEPNSVRARQSTVNGNNIRTTTFWLSLASLLTTITVLIVK